MKLLDAIGLVGFFAGLMSVGWTSAFAAAEDPSQKQLSEVAAAKGIMSFNAKRYDEARASFEEALRQDPHHFLALEYLGSIEEEKGDLKAAIADFVKAKHLAPESRWGVLNFQVGRLYLSLKNNRRAETYLRLALDENTHLTAANYLLGYLLYREGRYLEAHRYLTEAQLAALKPEARDEDRGQLQSIQYYLGEIDARLGWDRDAAALLREAEFGDSWEIRNGAWRVHSELNHPRPYLNLGLFLQYDSNVVLLPSAANLPLEFSSQNSFVTVVAANGGWQTSPTKKIIAGADGGLYANPHFNRTLHEFDVFQMAFDAWVNWWNLKDWSLTGRYDFADAMTDYSRLSTFQILHGPSFSIDYFPFQRWHWEAGFQYRFNDYRTDAATPSPDRRSGHSYIGFFKAGLRSPSPKLRPSLGYSYERDESQGVNFTSISHMFSIEADWRLFPKTRLLGGLVYARTDYPSNTQKRADLTSSIRLGIRHALKPRWQILFDATGITDSSTVSEYSYSRLLLTSGVIYSF